ncbi:MAG: response regulator [Crocinitomicaceae bacterium]|nr:response regulator [Crocinitomicaceae bacterium]
MSIQRILIVEDDLIIQMFISRVVQSAGFEVVGEARKCSQAVDIAREMKPDLILMDIGLVGEKDGIDAAEILNKETSIPIIFMTGNSDELTLERARKVNPVDIIFKPIDELRLSGILVKLREESTD